MIIRMGKARYAWVTAAPGLFMAFTTLYAGYLNITVNYLPKGKILLAALSAIIMVLVTILFTATFKRWYELLQIQQIVSDRHGDLVLDVVEE
jgi:carbon starvation protein